MADTRVSCYIPELIMFNLLSWLPVKSLLRFKSVCKLWLSIISDPKFIETQLNNFKKQHAYVPSVALIVKYGYENVELYSVDCSKDMARLSLQLSPDTRVVDSCNGLVCLANNDYRNIFIWNLSIKQCKILPAPNKRSKHYFNVVGFGYDSISNDYKFVRILIPDEDQGGQFDPFKLEAEMYSANADSWKEIHLPKLVGSFWPHRNCKRVASAIYGVMYFEDLDGILSFDLHNEVFKLYEYPDPFVFFIRKSSVLDFEGSVAMVFTNSFGDESVLSLWTLEDVCGKVSWTKKFDLELDYKLRDCVYGNLGAGQFVLKYIDQSFRYLLYDHKKKDTGNLTSVPKDASIFNYTESLISLKGFEQQSGK